MLRYRHVCIWQLLAGETVLFALKSRKDKVQIVVVGIASFMAIFPLCAWRHLDIIEKDLLERSEESLKAENLSGIEIEISGRDLLISAAAPDVDLAGAQERLSTVYGVRVVKLASEGSERGDDR